MEKADSVGYKLRLIHNQIHKRMEYNKTKNEYDTGDLTRMQRFTMGYMHRNKEKEIYQKDIEAEFAISRATASNMLTVMERKGLIIREPVEHDARLKKLVLTERAERMHQQVDCDMMETEELLTRGMNEDDKRILHQYLDTMLQNLVGEEGDATTTCCEKVSK